MLLLLERDPQASQYHPSEDAKGRSTNSFSPPLLFLFLFSHNSAFQHWLAVIFNRDEMFYALENLWNMAMLKMLETAESTQEEFEARFVDPLDGRVRSNSSASLERRTSTHEFSQSTTRLTRTELEQRHKNKRYQVLFRLPSTESLLKGFILIFRRRFSSLCV